MTSEIPQTGHPGIDQALADLELDVDLGEHHDRLARVHDALLQALNERPAAQPPLPAPRPES